MRALFFIEEMSFGANALSSGDRALFGCQQHMIGTNERLIACWLSIVIQSDPTSPLTRKQVIGENTRGELNENSEGEPI